MKVTILLIFLIVFICKNSIAQIETSINPFVTEFLVNDDAGTEGQVFPSIAMDPSDNFVIVWQDERDMTSLDIYFQRYNSTGSALGANIKVNDDVNNASQGNPSISVDAAGNFVATWEDARNGHNDIYFQRYSSAGSALGTNTKVNDDVNSAKQWASSISMDGAGNYVIVWIDERNDNRDIYYQRYTSTGAPLGVNTKVNDDNNNAMQTNPSIAMHANGDFVIVWQDFRNSNWDIYFQRYTSTGTLIGINTKVNDDTGSHFQYNSSIAMDATGNFIIIWQDYRNSNWDVFFQRYTNTGTTLGNNTKVNDDTGTEHQWLPTISINDVGDYVIVWDDHRLGQSGSKIFGQKYFSSGSQNGVNFRIVSGPTLSETTPVVSASNSSIIFSWTDFRRSKGYDIFAKIVNWNWNGVTSISDLYNNISKDITLSKNYPNPFYQTTKIKFEIPERTEHSLFVQLIIYDIAGNQVATLVNEKKTAGVYEADFDGSQFPSGSYYCQLRVGNSVVSKNMILIK